MDERWIDMIFNENCLTGMNRIPDKSVNLILCDLPYGTIKQPWDNVLDWDELWSQYKRIITDDGVIVLFGSQPFTTDLIQSNRDGFRYELIWDKQSAGNFIHAKRMPLKKHENICVFYSGTPKYNPVMQVVEHDKVRPVTKKRNKNSVTGTVSLVSETYDNKVRYPSSVLTYSSRSGELNSKYRLHPTQKPVELCEYIIQLYTDMGDIVLDNCMGSGTTAVAAIKQKRHFVGFELDTPYFEIAQKRIEQTIFNTNFGGRTE